MRVTVTSDLFFCVRSPSGGVFIAVYRSQKMVPEAAVHVFHFCEQSERATEGDRDQEHYKYVSAIIMPGSRIQLVLPQRTEIDTKTNDIRYKRDGEKSLREGHHENCKLAGEVGAGFALRKAYPSPDLVRLPYKFAEFSVLNACVVHRKATCKQAEDPRRTSYPMGLVQGR